MEPSAFTPIWIHGPEGQSLIVTRESELDYYKGQGWGIPLKSVQESVQVRDVEEIVTERKKPGRKPKNG